jgi:hypothetical protein
MTLWPDGDIIIQLKATKKWMEAAYIKSHMHVAFIKLIRMQHL